MGSKGTFEFGLIRYTRNLVFFLKEVTTLASTQAGAFTDKAVHLAEATILKSPPKHVGVCDCPSKEETVHGDLCTLIREVYPGERVVEPVFVHNIGKEAKEFQFQPFPLTDLTGQTVDTPVVSPDKVTLQPDEKALITITYETGALQPGQRYTSEILVKGYCEQKLTLIAHVFSTNAARCTILQKKPTRPHDWRDHFHLHGDKEDTKDNGKGESE